MSKTKYVVLSSILFVSALLLSSCASEPKVTPAAVSAPVAAQAPVEAAAPVEEPAKPQVAPEPAPAPLAVAETPAPKPKVHKAKKKATKAKPAPVAPPESVAAAPAPIAEPQTPAVLPPQPSPPAAVAPPVQKIAEESFLQQYWLWLLGLGIVIAGVVTWWRMSQRPE